MLDYPDLSPLRARPQEPTRAPLAQPNGAPKTNGVVGVPNHLIKPEVKGGDAGVLNGKFSHAFICCFLILRLV